MVYEKFQVHLVKQMIGIVKECWTSKEWTSFSTLWYWFGILLTVIPINNDFIDVGLSCWNTVLTAEPLGIQSGLCGCFDKEYMKIF